MTTTVGIRELKAKLSQYLGLVKSGRTIVITERGEPVARLTPVSIPTNEKLAELAATGRYTWNGEKLKAGKPLGIRKRSRKMISEIVLANRD